MLNFGDGLLGEMLNVRLVVTTNAKKLEMDPAVVRKRRLCRHVQIDLGIAQAEAVLRRLGADTKLSRDMVLADLYGMADAKRESEVEVEA